MENKFLDKIRKLLNLATKNTNAAEMEAAMAKAIELATQNGIDLASVQLTTGERKKAEYTKDSMTFGSRMPIVNDYVSSIVREYFNTKIILSGNRQYGRTLFFVGEKENVEMAKFVYSFLSARMMDLWHGYHEKTGCAVKAREPYFMGVYGGLHNKLATQRRATEAAASTEVAATYAVMIRDSKQDLEAAMLNFFPDVKVIGTKQRNTNNPSYSSGYAAGQSINIARPIGTSGPAGYCN